MGWYGLTNIVLPFSLGILALLIAARVTYSPKLVTSKITLAARVLLIIARALLLSYGYLAFLAGVSYLNPTGFWTPAISITMASFFFALVTPTTK